MNFDELMLLDPDDIPYKTIDDEMLKKLILIGGDFFTATNALAELSQRNSQLLEEISLMILEGHAGDKYLRASVYNSVSDS